MKLKQQLKASDHCQSRFYSSIAHRRPQKHIPGVKDIEHTVWPKPLKQNQLIGYHKSVTWTIFYFFRAKKNEYSSYNVLLRTGVHRHFNWSHLRGSPERRGPAMVSKETAKISFMSAANGWISIFNRRFHFLHSFYNYSAGSYLVLLQVTSKQEGNFLWHLWNFEGTPALDHFRNTFSVSCKYQIWSFGGKSNHGI